MSLLKHVLYITLLVIISISDLYGQEQMKEITEKIQEAKFKAIENNESWLSPIIAPAYTADAGFLIAGGALFTFVPVKTDTISQRSSLSGSVFYSSRGNTGINFKLNSFWLDNQLRLNSALIIKDKDNNYFGVGHETIEQTQRSDSTTLYHERFYDLTLELIHRSQKNYFIGLIINPVYTKLSDYSEGVQADAYLSQFEQTYFMNGWGGQLGYDTRDIVVNPWRGIMAKVSALLYDDSFGSKYTFQVYNFDGRFYQQVNRPGNILAFRAYARASHGNVPITQLSDFAGSKMIRGYPMGHYRDKSCSFILGEWRHTFQKRDKALSRSGFVLWAGIAGYANTVISMDHWLPNYGIGYRLELQPRMNVCVDFGVGKDTSGIYFNINEAF